METPGRELRQGDIIKQVDFPKWLLSGYDLVAKPGGEERRMIIGAYPRGPAIVCSHDCDIENPVSHAGILLAQVVRPEYGWPREDERWELLYNSSRPNATSEFEYGHLFPLPIPLSTIQAVDDEDDGGDDAPRAEPVPADTFAVADLSTMATAGPAKKAIGILLGRKTHEMTDEGRDDFGLKLAAFLGRGGQAPR